MASSATTGALVQTRLDKATMRKVRALAKRSGRSVAGWLRYVVREAVDLNRHAKAQPGER